MVGTATITAVLNACDTIIIPFVFGGDAGTLIVPGAMAEQAKVAMLDLQTSSVALYDLELRVGAMPVAKVRKRGTDVTVRKFLLSPGNHLATLAGGGADMADAMIKDPAGTWLLKAQSERPPPDLEGLSCRWQPLTSRDGSMMTLMVRALSEDPVSEGVLMRRVLANIARILGHDLTDSAAAATMRPNTAPNCAPTPTSASMTTCCARCSTPNRPTRSRPIWSANTATAA